MKRNTVIMLTLCTLLCQAPTVIYAQTDNYVSNVVKVGRTTSFSTSNAPTLILEASQSHGGNFNFSLHFSGSEWIGPKEGMFDTGVTYEQLDESWILVHVDTNAFDAKSNDIVIPLLVKVNEPGDSTVTVDGQNSSVSSGTYTFANYIDGEFTIGIKKPNDIAGTGSLDEITISDSTHMLLKKGDRIKLALSDGFRFEAETNPTVTSSGKFENIVDFSLDSTDSKTAYLTLNANSDKTTGKIVLSGLEIAPTARASYGNVRITLTTPGGNNATLTVARYIQLDKELGAAVKQDVVFNAFDPYVVRPLISGTWQPGKQILIKIDDTVIGNNTVDEDGYFQAPYPDTLEKLSVGSHTITAEEYLGPNTKSTYGHSTTLEILGEYTDNNITFLIGQTDYSIGGIKKPLDASAPYLDEGGHTMLPLRAVANILGISDSEIQWLPESKKVIIKKPNGDTLSLVVGESSMLSSSGETFSLDTPAVIRDGRIFLPMRAVLNGLGIYNKDILWNQATKSITVVRK